MKLRASALSNCTCGLSGSFYKAYSLKLVYLRYSCTGYIDIKSSPVIIVYTHTAQCRGVNGLPENCRWSSFSSNRSTHASWPVTYTYTIDSYCIGYFNTTRSTLYHLWKNKARFFSKLYQILMNQKNARLTKIMKTFEISYTIFKNKF